MLKYNNVHAFKILVSIKLSIYFIYRLLAELSYPIICFLYVNNSGNPSDSLWLKLIDDDTCL